MAGTGRDIGGLGDTGVNQTHPCPCSALAQRSRLTHRPPGPCARRTGRNRSGQGRDQPLLAAVLLQGRAEMEQISVDEMGGADVGFSPGLEAVAADAAEDGGGGGCGDRTFCR